MAQRYRGTIKNWKEDRGFGFIQPETGGSDVFLHITGLKRSRPVPKIGDQISYSLQSDQDGRVRATHAQLDQPALWWYFSLLALVWYGGVAFIVLTLSSQILANSPFSIYILLVMIVSPITFGFYGIDKRRAEADQVRIPETTLHTLELLGGWPGALLAQRFFRHKTRKVDYLLVYWAIVGAHVGLWIVMIGQS